MDTWFFDFTEVTNALAAVRGYPGHGECGVTLWPLRVTRYADSGEIVIRYSTNDLELLRFSAATNTQQYSGVLRMWCALNGRDPMTPLSDLLAEGCTFLDPPRIVADVWAFDIDDWSTCESNHETQAAAEAMASTSSRFMAMAEDDDGGMMLMDGVSCTITDEAAPFAILGVAQDTNGWTTITWESCSDHIYGVFSADQLSSNTFWTGRASMWGGDGSTSWTDTATTNLNFQFYRVVRMPPDGDFDGDGMPNGWEVDQQLDPLDYQDAMADPDGDGYFNLLEYLNGTDPHVGDSVLGFIINHGDACTTTTNVPVQAVSANYPKFLVSLDVLATNVTLYTNTGSPVTNALPDEGDGVYGVYAQYADADGNPRTPMFIQSVTLDRQGPVVAITVPASNAVLDQAFMTLKATVYDPGSLQPNTTALECLDQRSAVLGSHRNQHRGRAVSGAGGNQLLHRDYSSRR